MDRKVYVLCDANCKFESLTKEDIFAAIAEATGNVPSGVDEAFITTIKELHENDGIQFWVGTEAEYNALGVNGKGHIMKMDDSGKIYIMPGDTVNPPHAESHRKDGSDPITMEMLGVDVELDKKADRSTLTTHTLLASGWTGTTYSLAVSGVSASSNQEMLPGLNITAEQLEALQGANIQDGGQSEGIIVLKAYGDVPTINIPVRVIVRGDM